MGGGMGVGGWAEGWGWGWGGQLAPIGQTEAAERDITAVPLSKAKLLR